MYGEGELLQANVTAIAGVLIFMTIAPYSRNVLAEITQRKFILSTIWVTLTFFLVSIITLSFTPAYLFILSRILFIAGLIGIIVIVSGSLGSLPKIAKEEPRDK